MNGHTNAGSPSVDRSAAIRDLLARCVEVCGCGLGVFAVGRQDVCVCVFVLGLSAVDKQGICVCRCVGVVGGPQWEDHVCVCVSHSVAHRVRRTHA